MAKLYIHSTGISSTKALIGENADNLEETVAQEVSKSDYEAFLEDPSLFKVTEIKNEIKLEKKS